MKVFHCDHCRHLIFFENVLCVKCDRQLAFLPHLRVIGSLEPADSPGVFRSPLPGASGRSYRLCQNYVKEGVCNWAVPSDDPNPFCRSCRLTRKIPDLSQSRHRELWYKLEAAKRRLVYTLTALELPLPESSDHPPGSLVFEFLADSDDPSAPPVLTGHANGVITINIAEADDTEREKRRHALGEPYRTLLGHLRHETGHYYFDRLIAPEPKRLEGFRQMFGDERVDYAQALKLHYDSGGPNDWPEHFVSAYAASHPWEDWAESWAHYLHMVDVLEMAATCGLSLSPRGPHEPALATVANPVGGEGESFDALLAGWFPVTYLMNNLNRSLGLADAYPFVLSAPAIEKLRFVHEVVGSL